jgi:hypothetical protein
LIKIPRGVEMVALGDGVRHNGATIALTPARLFVQADAECCLRNDLMREEGVGGMEPAQTRIADQPFVARRTKDSVASGDIQPSIYDAPRPLDRAVFGGKNL